MAGVPDDKIRATSSSVDKLDKAPWEEVRQEMLGKGLSEDVADRVGRYVQASGTMHEMLANLDANTDLAANESIAEGIKDLKLLASYLEAMGVIHNVSFDLSLARGLDYYTGLIYEIVPDRTDQPNQVGSIAAGGRYDTLVGMYSRRSVPCVGISFGVDRIFTLLSARRDTKEHVGACPRGRRLHHGLRRQGVQGPPARAHRRGASALVGSRSSSSVLRRGFRLR